MRHRKHSGRFSAFLTKLGGAEESGRFLLKGVIAPDSAEIIARPVGNALPMCVTFSNNQTTVTIEDPQETKAFARDPRLAWSLHHGPRESFAETPLVPALEE